MSVPRILLVDDAPCVLRSLERFTRYDFESITCTSAAEAITAIDAMTEPPDGAVIDIFLSGVDDGLQVASHLRDRFGPDVPILLVSGNPLAKTSLDRIDELDARFAEKIVPPDAMRRFFVAIGTRVIGTLEIRTAVETLCERWRLAPRDARVLASLATGSTRSSLASDLRLAEGTLKSQLDRIYESSGLTSTEDLVASVLALTNDPSCSSATDEQIDISRLPISDCNE